MHMSRKFNIKHNFFITSPTNLAAIVVYLLGQGQTKGPACISSNITSPTTNKLTSKNLSETSAGPRDYKRKWFAWLLPRYVNFSVVFHLFCLEMIKKGKVVFSNDWCVCIEVDLRCESWGKSWNYDVTSDYLYYRSSRYRDFFKFARAA